MNTSTRKLLSPIISASAVVAGALVLTASPALAGGGADCTDYPLSGAPLPFPEHVVIDEVVGGNLTVPPGVACDIRNSTIDGSVTVADGAVGALIRDGSSIDGSVTAGSGTLVTVESSSISGNYECNDCRFLDLFDSHIDGNFTSTGQRGVAVIGGSEVGGNVRIRDAEDGVIVVDATVEGNFSMQRSSGRLFIAGSTIDGNARVEDNDFEAPEGAPAIVGTSVGGNVYFDRNEGPRAEISFNDIDGQLSCEDNELAPSGGDNTAAKKKGQCSDL